jgi:hypothetical protein
MKMPVAQAFQPAPGTAGDSRGRLSYIPSKLFEDREKEVFRGRKLTLLSPELPDQPKTEN